MWRFNLVTGLITQIVLGFGIGGGIAGVPGGLGSLGTLDFSRTANSDLIPILRRF